MARQLYSRADRNRVARGRPPRGMACITALAQRAFGWYAIHPDVRAAMTYTEPADPPRWSNATSSEIMEDLRRLIDAGALRGPIG